MLYLYLILAAACYGTHLDYSVKCGGAVSIGPSAFVLGSIESGGALTIGNSSHVYSNLVQSVGATSFDDYVYMSTNGIIVGGALIIGDMNEISVLEKSFVEGALTIGKYTVVNSTVSVVGAFTMGQETSCNDKNVQPCETSGLFPDHVSTGFNIGIRRDVPTSSPALENFIELYGKRELPPGKYMHSAAWSLPAGETMTFNGTLDDEWVIYIEGTAVINGDMKLIGAAQAKNIYWVVNGAFSTTTHSIVIGNVISVGAISIGPESNVLGSLYSNGACNVGALTRIETGSVPHSLLFI